MRRRPQLLFALVGLWLPHGGPAQGPDPRPDDVAAIERQEDLWSAATAAKDGAAAARLLAPEFTYALGSGRLISRDELVRLIDEDTDAYVSASNSGYDVRIYGDVGVARGIWTAVIQEPGGPVTKRYRWLDVWVRQKNGAWLCAASQTTRLAE